MMRIGVVVALLFVSGVAARPPAAARRATVHQRVGGYGAHAAGVTSRTDIAAPQPREFGARVQGRWSGTGTLAGRPMSATYTWRWVAAAAEMTVALYPPGMTTAVFEGRLIAPTDSAPGRWTDTQGADYRVTRVALSADSLVTEWGPDSARGRSVYRLSATDTLEVRDYRVNATTGTATVFGRYLTGRVATGGNR
jgi:hypothetical protein